MFQGSAALPARLAVCSPRSAMIFGRCCNPFMFATLPSALVVSVFALSSPPPRLLGVPSMLSAIVSRRQRRFDAEGCLCEPACRLGTPHFVEPCLQWCCGTAVAPLPSHYRLVFGVCVIFYVCTATWSLRAMGSGHFPCVLCFPAWLRDMQSRVVASKADGGRFLLLLCSSGFRSTLNGTWSLLQCRSTNAPPPRQ